jgi:hypothetical protein
MIRCASVILLVVALATCPFRCMGALDAASSSGKAETQCSCCRPTATSETPSAERGGETGEHGCDCCNCVCDGAVVEGHSEAPAVDAGAGIVLFETSPPTIASIQASRSYDFRNDLDPCGRTLRVLRQSFQL